MSTRLQPSGEAAAELSGPFGWLARLGLAWLTLRACLAHYGAVLLGRARLDLPALAAALRQGGLSVVPAITLVAAALGMILGSQSASILERFNLPGLVLLSLTYAAVIELVPVLVGILVAGRAGVALAVRQATLTVSGEMDGLIAAGIHPLRYTVAPALLAMLAMSFAFAVWASLVTFAAALLWLWSTAGISPAQFLDALRQALTPSDLAEALLKPVVFALLAALIAGVNGSLAGRDPGGVARAATRTMIGAVAAILLTDLAFILLWDG